MRPAPHYRAEARTSDLAAVRALTAATGFFSAEEVETAVELVGERLAQGAASGYEFLFLDAGELAEAPPGMAEELAGYTCFGPIPLTRSSFDLYWIAVDPALQGQGLGKALLAATEGRVRALGGERMYLDTSSRAQYQPTRAFYRACGYLEAAVLADFYAPGDGKVIHVKDLR